MNKLSLFIAAAAIVLPCFAREPVYVGEGRYFCSDNTIECATLKQRNNEISIRKQERWEAEQRYERYERRERHYERYYEYDRSDRYSDY